MRASKFLSRLLCLIPVGGIILSGCLPDESLSEIDTLMPSPQLALPLMKSTVNLSKIIQVEEGGLLNENDDHSYSIFYETRFSSLPLSDYFDGIPDQNYGKSFSAGISAPYYSISSPPITYYDKIALELSGQQFKEIGCKGGNLQILMSSDYHHEVKVKLTFPEIIRPSGESLGLNFILQGSGFGFENQNIDLSGFTLSPDQNELAYEIEITINGSGSAIGADEEVRFEFALNNVDFSYIEGKFKEFQIPVEPGLVEIPFLNNAVAGNISLNPTLRLHFTNTFGIPSMADFSNILVENNAGTRALEDKGNGRFFHENNEFPYPESRMSPPITFDYLINDENSNIEEVFSQLPKKMHYLLNFAAGGDSGLTNFITDNSSIQIDVEAEIPLAGNFNITLTDTLAIDLSDLEDVEYLKLVLQSENDFPLDVSLQVYFMDDFGKLITDHQGEVVKLFESEEKLLHAATIINENTGETRPVVAEPISAIIDGDKFDLIRNASNFLITTKLKSKSEDANKINLYSFYNIQLALAMQVKATLNN